MRCAPDWSGPLARTNGGYPDDGQVIVAPIEVVRTEAEIEELEWLARRLQGLPARRARRAKARAARLARTPPWADLVAIRDIYEIAVRRTAETGELHEVDHIIPLQGRIVSGLHVETNLRVIPWRENRAKSNQWEWVDGGS
jgi:hypothetical protein